MAKSKARILVKKGRRTTKVSRKKKKKTANRKTSTARRRSRSRRASHAPGYRLRSYITTKTCTESMQAVVNLNYEIFSTPVLNQSILLGREKGNK